MKRKFTTVRWSLLSVLAIGALGVAGCKKKDAGAPAPKATEGAASADKPVLPAPGSDTPASGSAGGSAIAAAAGTPTGSAAAPAGSAAVATAKNIVDTAKSTPNLSTFAKAIDAAGLADQLSGAGPFTVFAPSDDAFAKLPPADLQALLGDKAKLTAVLTYHVTPGAVLAKDLATQKSVKSVQGGDLAVDTSSGVKIAGATVVTADVAASNGVIHIIDTVLTPPK